MFQITVQGIRDAQYSRDLYQEALIHAREASALQPENAWAFSAQAEALLGLRRPQEATNSIKQALRLSDGKYATMHFHLGSAYFQMENWDLSRQSFQKAAELNGADDAAAYNVGICFVRLSFFRDAAQWYEEALRRNPNRRDKQDLLRRIRELRN